MAVRKLSGVSLELAVLWPSTRMVRARSRKGSRGGGPVRVVRDSPWDVALRGGTALWLLSRVVIELTAGIASLLHPGPNANPRGMGFFFLLNRWDSGWFTAIATHGYHLHGNGNRAYAFFPGYPLLARWCADLLGGVRHPHVLGFTLWLIPQVGVWVAAVFLWRLAEQSQDRTVAAWSGILLLFGPCALFLVASYSEGLFLAFAIPAWWACRERRYLLAGVLGALAGTTRVSGLFLAVALVVMYLADRREHGVRPRARELGAVAISLIGSLVYLADVALRTHSWAGWFHAQGTWGRHLTTPWLAFVHQWHRAEVGRADLRDQAQLELAVAAICVWCLVVMIRRRLWPEAVFVGLSLLALMTSSNYGSLARNALTLFPVYLLLAGLARGRRSRWLLLGLGVAGVVMLMFDTKQFVIGNWAG